MRNSIQLSPETETKTEAARQALGILRKTFEQWTVIGAAIVALRERADDLGGRKTFHRLLEQQGLGTFVTAKAITSRLEKIMANLPEVTDWHRRLTPKQQIEWSAPTSVIRHCPIFQKEGTGPKPRPQPAVAKPENLAKIMEQQEARIEELEQELEAARAAQTARASLHDGSAEGAVGLQCVFCNKGARDVVCMVVGRNAAICNVCAECAVACAEQVREEQERKTLAANATKTKRKTKATKHEASAK